LFCDLLFFLLHRLTRRLVVPNPLLRSITIHNAGRQENHETGSEQNPAVRIGQNNDEPDYCENCNPSHYSRPNHECPLSRPVGVLDAQKRSDQPPHNPKGWTPQLINVHDGFLSFAEQFSTYQILWPIHGHAGKLCWTQCVVQQNHGGLMADPFHAAKTARAAGAPREAIVPNPKTKLRDRDHEVATEWRNNSSRGLPERSAGYPRKQASKEGAPRSGATI
jgi:hypothetical protein